MKKKTYGMKIDSLLYGIQVTEEDLEFLCSLIETPDKEYQIPDAVDYSRAVMALENQLSYMNQMSENDLTEDEELIKLTKEQLLTLNALSDEAEYALGRLRSCGISLKRN